MAATTRTGLEIRLLGPMRVLRDGVEIELPKSRKVRVLLAVLALEPGKLSRSRLCDLLWDAPNDPRGELRWCLSKLRSVIDDDTRPRVIASGSTVELDLTDCIVDAKELERAVAAGLPNAATERLSEIADLVAGDLLDGLQVDGAELTGWLAAQRQRLRAQHVALLRELVTRAPRGSDEMFARLEALLARAPFDVGAHETMLHALVAAGRLHDAEEHASTTIRTFERDGVDWDGLRAAWQRAKTIAGATTSTIEIAAPPPPPVAPRRGSIVVMPFASENAVDVANGITDDIITRLAKLRALFVIARGTSYALRERGVDTREAGRLLDVAYVVSGVVRRHADRVSILVELAETAGGLIVWTDELEVTVGDTLTALDSIVDRIVATIAEEIERAESKRAILKPPSSLDAWEAYHRGLWHMYRFTGPDNETAARFFRDALALDPELARAHAGLSFTHFQNVFLGLTPDRDAQVRLALETATRSLVADDRDPASHWAMGRALWLSGDAQGISELEQSIELSPNFALGHYTLGFVHSQSGDPAAAISAADYSRQLSPFDPLQFGMLGSRAMAHMRLGQREEAAEWAVKAANRPNAHAHILAIAATNLGLAGRRDQARAVVARIRARQPGYTIEDFLRAFRFGRDGEQLVREGARLAGLD
jgi:DNA-binding SARP family transcriptional activator/TolB-like protein